jgi:hypothetical protein
VDIPEQPERQWKPFFQHAQAMIEGRDVFILLLVYILK